MSAIDNIGTRINLLRKETQMKSISPERLGSILNDMHVFASPLGEKTDEPNASGTAFARIAALKKYAPNVFDGDKVDNIVQEGGFSDVFVVDGQTVDPKPGDLLFKDNGIYGEWGVIVDIHLEVQDLYVTYVWGGIINTIMIDENGDAARYVNRYYVPTVYDAESVLSASIAGNMQDFFLIKDPDNPTQSFFKYWKVGDLIGNRGIIVSDHIDGLTRTMQYIYDGKFTTITCTANSPSKIKSISTAIIGNPTDAANKNGSIYARITANKDAIGNTTDAAKEDGSLYARIKYLMDKKNYKRYNRKLLDALTTQSTPAEIEAAFTPIGESEYRKPKEGDIFIEGDGQWLGSGRDYIVTFCSEYFADWTMVCGGSQKELVLNYTNYDATKKITVYKTREVGWPSDFSSGGSSYAKSVNELLMSKIYALADATYNWESNTYTFHGLKMTPDDMLKSFLYENCIDVRVRWERYCYYSKKGNCRINFVPLKLIWAPDAGNIEMEWKSLAYVHPCEKFVIPNLFIPTKLDAVIQGCNYLTEIVGDIDLSKITSIPYNCFNSNKSLEIIKIKKLKCNISFKSSPKINYDSWRYLVDNAANESAITVTVDPVPFALLTGTAPDEVYTPTGHSKEEWMAINTDAQEKQISFAEQV